MRQMESKRSQLSLSLRRSFSGAVALSLPTFFFTSSASYLLSVYSPRRKGDMIVFPCVSRSKRLSGERNSPNFSPLLFLSNSLLPSTVSSVDHKMELKGSLPPRTPSRIKVRDKQVVKYLLPSLPFLPPPSQPPLPPFLEPPYLVKNSIDLSLEERPPPPYSCNLEEEEPSNSSSWKKVGRFFRLLLCGACESFTLSLSDEADPSLA